MNVLFSLLGLAVGTGEFFLTKGIADRALVAKPFWVPLTVKLFSYAALAAVVVLLFRRDWILPFGIGLGGGLLTAAFIGFIVQKGKR